MRPFLTLVSALLLAVMPLLQATPAATPTTAYDPDQLVSIRPDLREDVAAAMPAGMTSYDISLSIPDTDPATGIELAGQESVIVTNTTDAPLTELPFRLYGNTLKSPQPEMMISSVAVDGAETTWTMRVNNSAAIVPLADALAPGDLVQVEIVFTLVLPVDDASHYGMLNYSTENQTAVIAHWYPVLAGWDPNTGWMMDPPSIFGDPIFTDAGLYTVTITAPSNRTLITSGLETDRREQNGLQTVTFDASPSRDFSIVMSESLEPTGTIIDGTTVTSWALPEHQSASEHVADWTADTLRVFNPLLGEYPWLNLQVIEARLFDAAGVELPQMTIMGQSFYTQQISDGSYFEFTTAHEAVHMWFYNQVGNNQYAHAFMDEGLTNYLSADVYFRLVYGDEFADVTTTRFLAAPFRRMIEANEDVIVDFPTDSFPNASSYVSAVYTKAPMGFGAIHDAMGTDAFFAALHDYVNAFRFRVATPADQEASFLAHTDVDVRALWSHWFELREGGLDIRES